MSSAKDKMHRHGIDDGEIMTISNPSLIPLSDEILEKVDGGFNSINTCRRRFEEYACLNGFAGRCQDLIVIAENKLPQETMLRIKCKNNFFAEKTVKIMGSI